MIVASAKTTCQRNDDRPRRLASDCAFAVSEYRKQPLTPDRAGLYRLLANHCGLNVERDE